ncbi:unnamed protein product, partial [Urochloa humidicola]
SFFLLPSRAATSERAGWRPRSLPAQLRPAPPLPSVAAKAGAPVPRRCSASRRLVPQVLPRPAAEIHTGYQGGGRGRALPLAAEDWTNVTLSLLSTGSLANAAGSMEEMSDDDSLLEYNEIVMMMFGNEDEGFEFYNCYAYEKGFSVRKEYCEWDNGHNERTLRKFVCSCEGFRAEKELKREVKMRRPRNITRCGCCAKLVIALDQNTRQWYVKDFIDEHNHPMMEEDLSCFLRSHRRISDDQKAEIVQLLISGIRKHQIMDIMIRRYGGYDKVGFTARDLYNFCHVNKLETLSAGDAQTIMRYMIESKRRDPDFFFQYKTDGRGHLTGLLWCDFQCQMDYRAFGDVVVFDGTYKTNKYNMPLVPFVGVNHHKSTVIFAFGIVSHEDTESYVWLLRSFSDAMIQKHPVSLHTLVDFSFMFPKMKRLHLL